MKLRTFTLFVLALFCANPTFAQYNIVVKEDDAVRRMLDQRKELNFKTDRYVRAWSIQIMVSRDKYLINKRKEEFSKEFNDVFVDWEYEQPYYKLNVGAYYTKLEATMAMQKFLKKYPDAYVFKNSKSKSAHF